MRANVPITETGTLTLVQDGQTVTGTATFPDDGTMCPFTGAVTGDSPELTSSSCQPESIEFGVVPGCGEQGWTLELTGRTFSGTVNETTIAGRGTETGNAMSGGDTYPMTVTSSVTMRRQPMEQPDGLGAVRCLVKSFIYMGLSLTASRHSGVGWLMHPLIFLCF